MDDKEWLTSLEVQKILGYKDRSSANRTCDKYEVRTKEGWRRGTKLFLAEDVANLLGKISYEKDTTKKFFVPQKFNTHLRLKGDCMIISDMHCPLIDWELWKQSLKVRDKYKISQLLLAGDFLNCSAQSPFYTMFPIPWEDEKESARAVLKECGKEYDKIYLLTANHELRYMKLLKAQYDPSTIEQDKGYNLDVWQNVLGDIRQDLKDKSRISIYPYCDIGKDWRVFHPATARKQPLSLARELSNIHGKSAIVTHAHLTGWCMAPDGKKELIDCGVFADPLGFDYKNLRVTAHYAWNESFVAIVNGHGRVFLKGREESIN